MRLAKPRLAAVSAIALTLAVAGCGGNTVTVQEVPGGPVDLTVPGSAEALAPEPTATPSATATETPDGTGTAEATATPDAGAAATDDSQTQTAPETDTDGAAEAPSTDDSATNDQPPPAGSDAQQFEDFCAQNPGAC